MSSTSDDWSTACVQSLPVGCVAFNLSNTVTATCAGCFCILYTTSDGKRRATLEHADDLVSAFFVEQDKLITITKCGEMLEWTSSRDTFLQISSHKLTNFIVKKAFYLREEERCVLVVDHETHITVENVMQDRSLTQIAQLPAGLSPEQISVTSSFVTYCSGKEVFAIPTDDNPMVPASSYLCKTHIEGFGDRNAANGFVRITALGDTIAATLSIGRVYVWSHVSQKGIQDSAFSVHWHKVAPSLVLTPFGGLLSAGAETVLCKFTLSGAGRPSMLPHLAAPVRDLAISEDASHLAVILEDNSVHIVITSSMTLLSSLQTVVTCDRSLNTVFCGDPLWPGALVMNGKPGSLQWIDCEKSLTRQQVSFSLENVADGDMSFTGITSTFPDVERVFFLDSVVVTLEQIINFDEDHKRLRFWKRTKEDEMTVQLLDSFIVPKDTVSISGTASSSTGYEKIVLSIMSCGKVNVWIPHDEGARFKLDPTRHLDRRYAFHAGSTVHNGMWASAHPEGENNTDAVIVWDTSEMREVEALRTDGRVHSVEFDGKGHLVCATDKSVRCWRHVALRFEFLWVVEQSLRVHVSRLGAFAWSENTVIEFDAETAAMKNSVFLDSPIIDLVAIPHDDLTVLVTAKTEKGLYFAHPKASLKKSEEQSSSTAKTPFAQLAPVKLSSSQKNAEASLRPAGKAAAMRLLEGPAHTLPPISHIAPLFISHCLAPPLQE
ncbi:hypothetical protein V3C99_004439 [Haemonchus contortus]